MRPDPQAGAMPELVATLMQFDDVNRFIGAMTSGLSTRCEVGSERDEAGRLVGDKPIHQGGADVSLYALMQDGAGVLLDASTDGKASALVAATAQRIRCVAVDTESSMLIRPDACVAWIGEESGPDGLEEALGRWFTPPPGIAVPRLAADDDVREPRARLLRASAEIARLSRKRRPGFRRSNSSFQYSGILRS